MAQSLHRLRRALTLAALLAAVPAMAEHGPAASEVLACEGTQLILTAPAAAPWPGERRGVYLSEARPDPRSGALVDGWRYAGDGRVVWSGEGVIELELEHDLESAGAASAVLRAPLNGSPTAAWMPPLVEPREAPVAVEQGVEEVAGQRSRLEGLTAAGRDRDGVSLGRVYDLDGYTSTSLRVGGGFAGDGFDAGASLGSLAWRRYPARGLGLVELGLEGLWAQRWIRGEGEEAYGQESAVGYRVWSRLDTPGVGLALIGGGGAGIGAEGLNLSGLIGVRTGHPDATRAELTYEVRGGLGGRTTLDGRVAVSDGLRVGVRSRLGDLPRHDEGFRQLRADGAALLSANLGHALILDLAAGAGGYDLLWADAGLVLDGALEVRW